MIDQRATRRLSVAVMVVSAVAWPAAAGQDHESQPAENPYLARDGLSAAELLEFIEKMESKPRSIRERPGFSAAIVDAADRILAADAEEALETGALVGKLKALHFAALGGDADAERQLHELAEVLGGDPREPVAREARFHLLEQRVLGADDLEAEQLIALLDELRDFFSRETLEARHLRLASGAVRIMNRLPDDEMADRAYREFGALWAKSEDRELSKYGRKIEKGAKPATLVGKPLELAGTALDGTPFDWSAYRGKVVLVDFWATWCGPCVAELPNLKQNYAAYHERGFEVVGVSLDEDRQALEQFIAEEQITWANLFGDDEQARGWRHPLAAKYGVEAIPATFLVDRDGKVVAENVRGPHLAAQLEKLLGPAEVKPAGRPDDQPPAEKAPN